MRRSVDDRNREGMAAMRVRSTRDEAVAQTEPSRRSIPDKLYFKIGEVSRITGLEPYVLRYWESEFDEVCPVKTKSNQRRYRRRDIEVLLEIRRLLYDERFTIAGAKRRLKELKRAEKAQMDLDLPVPEDYKKVIGLLRKELEEIRAMLE